MISVDMEKCSGCGLCKDACMFGAIEMREDGPCILEACVNCGACVRQCPCEALCLPQEEPKNLNLDAYQDVWVVLEMDLARNQLKKVSLELLSEARRLADLCGQNVGAVFVGKELPEEFGRNLSMTGCDYVHVVTDDRLKRYHTLHYSRIIVEMAEKYMPAVILLPATENGRDLAPRVSCLLQTGLTADCTGLDIDEKGNLVQIRPTYGGNIMASIISPDHRPQMASVRPNVLSVRECGQKRETEILMHEAEIDETDQGYSLKKVWEKEDALRDVTESEIVIVAGYGIGSKENFKKIEKLALKLNAAVGATRKVVDEGWAPFEVQVGQTGKTIAPDVYLSFGVSGALQHTIGIQNAKFKIAVNNDPAAPVFKMCDAAILGDCMEVAEAMISELS